ncbi:MAG TPA: GAF domain-containing protein, partial [Anaerolineaceae bacterium]|nr:GAF domain-containing protein [Anaerolineaceae bacterium]
MVKPGQASAPEWKQFLRLGEKILAQPNAAAQCTMVEETIHHLHGANSKIWLAEPFYPLPGEPDIETLPAENAPPIVDRAFSSRAVVFNRPDGFTSEFADSVHSLALPLVTQEFLLGVLHVERPDNSAFRPDELAALEGIAAHTAVYLQIARQVTIKSWRSDQLALVRRVSAQIANVLDLDELCKHVTELIQRSFHYYYVGIFTTGDADDHIQFRASAGAGSNLEPPFDFSLCIGEGLVGHAAANGEEITSQDVRKEPRYRSHDALPETRSEAALPLKVKNRVLGVLDVQSDEPEAFHENDMIVLRALADNIALAVEGARLYSGLRHRADQISTVFDVSHALTSILDLDELLDEVVSVIQKRFGYPYVHVYTTHAGRQRVFYAAGSGARSQAFHEHEVNYDLEDEQGIIPYVARTGKSVLANDVTQEPLYRPTDLPPSETRAELAIPLTFGGEVLGVLDLQSDQVNAFDSNDRFLLEALAGTISVAVRNAILYRSEQWRRQVADSFRDVAGLVSANVAIHDLLDTILDELEKNLPCEASAIWLVDDPDAERPMLKLAAVRGLTEDRILTALASDEVVRSWLSVAIKTTRPIIRQPTDPYGPLGKALDFPSNY